MSRVNRGKQFEQQVRKAFENVSQTSVYRLQDSMGGYSGVANICDFIVYHYPNQYFIECKSCYNNTLPFSNITTNQWQGMLKMSKIKGIKAGILVWFMDWDRTYFIDIQELQRLKDAGSKSVNIKAITDYSHNTYIPIRGIKKRVLFDYDMTSLFKNN